MCGICGYVGDDRPELLEPMCLTMAYRGPDDMGVWHDSAGRVGLGHRRLAIIDLSPAGHQPMCNEDGTVWITYNGETYNFRELRQRLEKRGHVFRSQCDTEVLIHLYEDRGIEFLQELNGIFALAIWDGRNRQLLLARDHAGIKPVYYWQDGERLFFASEIKALLRIPGIPRRLRRDLIPQYLRFMWIPGQDTLLEGIKKVEPGHYLLWKDGRIETRQWFFLAYEPDNSVPEQDWVERVHDVFMQTIRRQMVSDVPLGVFLSGGTDSSSIVACMRHSFPDQEITCYTTYYGQKEWTRDQMEDDYPYARRVAEILGLKLQGFELKANVVDLLGKMIYHNDEPDADPTVFPSYLISRFAREHGTTVLLSGMGGDEVFFGYRSHQAYRYAQRLLRWTPSALVGPVLRAAASLAGRAMGAQTPMARRMRKFGRLLPERGLQRHLAIVDWSSPEVRQGIYTPEFLAALGELEPVLPCMQKYFDSFIGRGEINRHTHLLIQTFLAAHNFMYTDKSSMATSIEVRVPFMDVELMRLGATIPERYKLKGIVTKSVLKKAMERYLPRDVLYRGKTGFGPPLRKWIAEDLDAMVNDALSPQRLKSRGLFDPAAVRRIIDENRANRADHAYLVYALMTLELWEQTFIDRPGQQLGG